MLRVRGLEVDVRPDLEGITSDTPVLTLDPSHLRTRSRRPLALLGGIVAATIVVTVVSVTLVRGGGDSTTVGPAGVEAVPLGAYFPVFGDLPDDFDSRIAAFFTTPDRGDPAVTYALVGQRGPERWTDVSRVSVREGEPDLDFVSGEQILIGGIEVTRLRYDDGQVKHARTYILELAGTWVTVDTPVTDPALLLTAIRAEPGDPPLLSFENLPPGTEVLAGPRGSSTLPVPSVFAVGLLADPVEEPESTLGNELGSSGRTERLVQLQTFTGNAAEALGPGDYDIVSVGGQPGVLSREPNSTKIAWTIGGEQTATLVTADLTTEEALDIANAVTFVDEATWRRLYNPG